MFNFKLLIIISVTNNFSKLFQLDHLDKSNFLEDSHHQIFTIWQLTAVTTIPLSIMILINCKIMCKLRTSTQINGQGKYSYQHNGLRIHTRQVIFQNTSHCLDLDIYAHDRSHFHRWWFLVELEWDNWFLLNKVSFYDGFF